MDKQTGTDFNKPTVALFNKLVRLHRLGEGGQGAQTLPALVRVALAESGFARAMLEIEGRLKRSDRSAPAASPVGSLTTDEWKTLCQVIDGSTPLRELFLSE
ncbi:MAG: hypothetical protein H7Z38_04420, partial [Rubrivivax sp.]|nr:hypothetical protein [Pyrinomonadaceae bacterium]